TRASCFLMAPIKIENQDAGLLIVDTGSNGLIIERYVAQSMKLPQVGSGSLSAIGGRPTVETLAAKSVSLGGVTIDDTFVVCTDLATMRKETAAASLTGLLGGSILARVPFTIDYRNATLTLYDPASFKPPADAR